MNRSTLFPGIPLARVFTASLFLVVALALTAGPAAAEEFRFGSDRLVIGNLIGEINVTGGSGSEFVVTVTPGGKDYRDGAIDYEVDERRGILGIVFPKDTRRYVYPAGNATLELRHWERREKGLVAELMDAVFGSGRIKVSKHGGGKHLWADVRVEVPRGAELVVLHGVGDIMAANVDGDITLDSHAGVVRAEDIEGRVMIDTGSGEVEVAEIVGELEIDTGSGQVTAVSVDGQHVQVDTGSGRVSVSGIRTRELEIDTGSGGVRARDVSTESATIDTGSGGVELTLTEMGDGDFTIDTGSGSITLLLPSDASAQIEADTGSGGIHIDAPDARIVKSSRDFARVIVGSGDARVHLDTGSGGIRVEAQ